MRKWRMSDHGRFLHKPMLVSEPGQRSRYSNSLWGGQFGDLILAGARISAPLQTGPEAYLAFYTMGTGFFPGVKQPGRGVDHPPHLAPRLKKEHSYTSTPCLGIRGLFQGELYFALLYFTLLFYLNINQLDALNFIMSLFHASTCFEHHVLIVRRAKLYYTASGIITPIGGRPVHRLRED